jgi:CelD/BcsL family acetyltransferase involved in cellulose biosynthesis
MRVESIHPRYLSASDVAAWRSFLRADPELSSPYLTPDWARLVAVHRSDVRVAVFRTEAGEPLGFLPVQRCGDFAAMPAGGPICDYQALAAKPGVTLDLAMAPKALSVGRIDLTAGLLNNAVGSRLLTSDAGHVVRFVGGYEAWCAERLAAGTKTIAKTRKKLAKMTRDLGGEVTFDAFSTDPYAFETLMTWKREQMKRTGVRDIFEHAWIDGVVRGTFAAPGDDHCFGGAMFVLRVEGAPAAVLFCLRADKALHAWYVAHDNQWAQYSPGLIVFVEAIRAAAEAGYTELDLGPGEYQFKESLANASRACGAGFIAGQGLSPALKAAQFQVRAMVESLPVGRVRQWPAKAMRRLDIARGLAAPAGRVA